MTIKFSLQSSISGTSVIVALVIHLPDVILAHVRRSPNGFYSAGKTNRHD